MAFMYLLYSIRTGFQSKHLKVKLTDVITKQSVALDEVMQQVEEQAMKNCAEGSLILSKTVFWQQQ